MPSTHKRVSVLFKAKEPASPTLDSANDWVTESELRLVAEWHVADLQAILNDPAQARERAADDFVRFHERAGRVMEALLALSQPSLFTIRFGIGGVSTQTHEPVVFSDEALTALWRQERPVYHWARKDADELNGVAALGRAYALADAALEIQQITKLSRLEAIAQNVHDAFLRQIFLRAFNLYGINPLHVKELGINGVDPWMQVAASKHYSPATCTAQQLLHYARRQFRDYAMPFEVFSILMHLPERLNLTERLLIHDWSALLQQEVSAAWMRGEEGKWLEEALQSLSAPSSGQLRSTQGA